MEEHTAKQVLENCNIKKQDARYILCYILNVDNVTLLTNDKIEITDEDIEKFENIVKKIENGMPLEYAIGKSSFMGLDFFVNENVLIPRLETELLVSEVIKYINTENKKSFIDMCCGSGCIFVSILHFTKANCTAVDISREALNIAKKNATHNNILSRVNFIESDLFRNIDKNKKVDIIVSNPPYIPTKDMTLLEESVKNYEPNIALDGGINGLYFYNQIAKKATDYLLPDGTIFLEIGYNQGEDIKNIFKNFANVTIKKDYANHDRIAIIKK